jgi:hypothetical protein
VRTPIDVDRLDARSRALAAQPPVDDAWAERGVVEVLRTRALIAEMTASVGRLRDLVAERAAEAPEPERPRALA